MTVGTKIIKGAKEALAVARGEQPAAAIYHNGHRYVPAQDYQRLVGAILQIVARSHNGELGTSKVIDMRRIAEEALEGGK